VKQRVTSINGALGKDVDFNEVCLQLARGFERSLGIELEEGQLKETEIALANEIKRARYQNPQWNHRK
jgi:lipoate-protein ligase A